MTFDNLPATIADALRARSYDTATPVQAAVLEPETADRDLLVSAQTGSGKTVAFGLAMAGQVQPRRALLKGQETPIVALPPRTNKKRPGSVACRTA